MRNISSAVLSLAAMVLSSMTTYLTFFDARYTLTAAVADVNGDSNRGSGRGNGRWNVDFRFYAYPTIILSNRGTRALVVSEVNLVRSSSLETCNIADDTKRTKVNKTDDSGYSSSPVKPFIIEPGTVSPSRYVAYLDELKFSGVEGETPTFSTSPEQTLYCFEWVVYDPNGKRHESTMPAFTSSVTLSQKDGEAFPSADYKLDHPKGALQLLTRGLI